MKRIHPLLKQNESTLDRVLRVSIGSLALVAGFFWFIGLVQVVAYIIGVIALITGIVGFCGLYALTGISTCANQKIEKPNLKITVVLLVISIAILGAGSFASMIITRNKFLEDFTRMNGFYKQTLFLTGQSKRDEAKNQYDSLVNAYAEFQNKYQVYRPYVIRNDSKFSEDLANVNIVILSVKDGVYTGDLSETHKKLESIRPIFQEMFKRNGFSMFSMALVDFHDIMEKLITAADAKNANQLLEVYPEANSAFQIIEREDTSNDVKIIRRKLDELRNLAESGQIEKLSAKAAELKASFIKVYLLKG